MKQCIQCNTLKNLEEFSKDKNTKDGLCPYCIPCRRGREKLSYQRNKEKVRARQKEYYKTNVEAFREYNKSYYEANKEAVKICVKKYRQKNKKSISERDSNYRKKNRPKMNALSNKYRASKLKATPAWLTGEQLKEIEQFYWLAKDLEAVTGEKYHVDHIVPLQGKDVCGLHVPWNLQVLPADVNLTKGSSVRPREIR